jgi:hypothetical protein
MHRSVLPRFWISVTKSPGRPRNTVKKSDVITIAAREKILDQPIL